MKFEDFIGREVSRRIREECGEHEDLTHDDFKKFMVDKDNHTFVKENLEELSFNVDSEIDGIIHSIIWSLEDWMEDRKEEE